jgi:NADH-quinone oxidoreductase subunit D
MKEKLNEDGSELSILNLGPTHPATHGFSNVLLMDGERILEAEPTIGYIHRAFEKLQKTDLLPNNSYRSHELLLSSINMGWWMTLENYSMLKYLNVPIYELL